MHAMHSHANQARVADSPPIRCRGLSIRYSKTGAELVGGTGIEPVTSSVSEKSVDRRTSYVTPPVAALAADMHAARRSQSAAIVPRIVPHRD
jgi:hypothetical protein